MRDTLLAFSIKGNYSCQSLHCKFGDLSPMNHEQYITIHCCLHTHHRKTWMNVHLIGASPV
jgi:hypothetical protein